MICNAAIGSVEVLPTASGAAFPVLRQRSEHTSALQLMVLQLPSSICTSQQTRSALEKAFVFPGPRGIVGIY